VAAYGGSTWCETYALDIFLYFPLSRQRNPAVVDAAVGRVPVLQKILLQQISNVNFKTLKVCVKYSGSLYTPLRPKSKTLVKG